MRRKASTKNVTTSFRVINSAGKVLQANFPLPVPSDTVPGEIFGDSSSQPTKWYMFVDKQRAFINNAWQVGGTIMTITTDQLNEKKLYPLRKRMLQRFGWIK